jgi:hypothetical protein
MGVLPRPFRGLAALDMIPLWQIHILDHAHGRGYLKPLEKDSIYLLGRSLAIFEATRWRCGSDDVIDGQRLVRNWIYCNIVKLCNTAPTSPDYLNVLGNCAANTLREMAAPA